MRRWLPTSKMTAVGIAGAVYTYGVWALETYWAISFQGITVAANATLILFTIGYVTTENRAWTR